MTTKGTPENTVILHWDECQTAWAELPWQDWVRFRTLSGGMFGELTGAEAGEHFFLVCVLGDRGELCNVIPHRYVMSAHGRLVHGFDGLGAAEREESCKLEGLPLPSIEDTERYKELGARGFSVNLPPQYTVQSLLKVMPGLAGAQEGAACWNFLSAIGVCRSGTQAH